MKIDWSGWQNSASLGPKDFICGYCGNTVGSRLGFFHSGVGATIYICPSCGCPSFFYGDLQCPGPFMGRVISNLPPDVDRVYFEIKESIKNGCFTAVLLLGRKLIMHIAVDKAGAKEGESFEKYVEHLKNSGFVPPNGDKILGYIRSLGNEKNHEIKIGSKEEASKILKFIEVLLIFIYEFNAEFGEKE